MDDESADSIALRCFLRDSVTVDLNFILAGATKKNRRGGGAASARGRERTKKREQ